MMRSWVFDTNVIVAAHLSPHGPPARLISEVYSRRLRLSCDLRMSLEYEEVMMRPKFGFPPEAVHAFIHVVEDQDWISPFPISARLPDPEDTMFLEVAAATEDKILVTGNKRHFPSHLCGEVTILSPLEAWQLHCSSWK